jgi:AmiR/NasT family two-component response regulator
MGRHHCSPDAAFDLLVRQSRDTNRKLRDIAQDIVDDVQRDGEA